MPPSEDLLELLECSVTTKDLASLNQRFHLKGCEVRIILTFTSFLLTGNWVVRDSENPDKVSFFFLGPNKSGKSYSSSNKEQLKTHFQQIFGSQLSMSSIETLIAGNYSKMDNFSDLESQTFASHHSLRMELFHDAVHKIKFH